MTNRLDKFGLLVDPQLCALVEDEILPGTGVDADIFWKSLSDTVRLLTPKNRDLLAKRGRFATTDRRLVQTLPRQCVQSGVLPRLS